MCLSGGRAAFDPQRALHCLEDSAGARTDPNTSMGSKIKRLLPWGAIPLFALLACEMPLVGGVSLRVVDLWVPLAALLAHQFGRRGVAAAAIGLLLALYAVNAGWPWVDYSSQYQHYFRTSYFERRPFWPFLPMSLSTRYGSIRPDLGAGIVAFAAALLAGGAGHLRSMVCPRARLSAFSAVPSVVAIAVLPIGLILYREDMGGGFTVFSALDLTLLLYAYLLALGWLGAKPALVIGALALACGFGVALEWLGVARDLSASLALRSVRGAYFFEQLRYGLRAPIHLGIAACCFALGCELRRISLGAPARGGVQWPWVLFAFLLLMWGAGPVHELLTHGAKQPSAARPFLWLVDPRVVPLTALLAGAVYRLRGVACAMAYSLGLVLVGLAWLRFGWIQSVAVPLDEPFMVLAFGALGAAWRERLDNTRTEWHPLHWMAYLAMLLISVPQQFDLEDASQRMLAAASVAALLAGAAGFGWLWRRATGSTRAAAPGGWLAFAALVGALAALGPALLEAGKSLVAAGTGAWLTFTALFTQVQGKGDLSDTSVHLAFVPVYLALVLAAVAAFIESLPQIADDVQVVVASIRRLRSQRAPEAAPVPACPDVDTSWRQFVKRCASVVRWASGTAFVAAISLLLLFVWPNG